MSARATMSSGAYGVSTVTRRSRDVFETLSQPEPIERVSGSNRIDGDSPCLRRILRQIELVAPTEANVLILGESGNGKRLVASAIHARSERWARSLIKVNCAAIPRDLFESEFFGHVRGAFAGAITDRAGCFERADGGTLFLEEIAEIPLDLQGKLLHVLEQGRCARPGCGRSRRMDVRVIAATRLNLASEVSAGNFREDLYRSLNLIPIEIPPLGDHPGSISRLALSGIGSSYAFAARVFTPRLSEPLIVFR
ncbi:MAG: sigma-54 factor interaction domain-containing protein [Gammaproteobacteria bacterium]